MANAQHLVVNVNAPIFGEAGSGISYSIIRDIDFECAFCPTQGSDNAIPPAFSVGFELLASTLPNIILPGLVGHAHLHHWIQDDNGYYTGAGVAVGVVNMSDGVKSDTPHIPYTGMIHMHFSGTAIILPIDIPEYGDD